MHFNTSGDAACILRNISSTFRAIPERRLLIGIGPKSLNFLASESSYITYTALIEIFLDNFLNYACTNFYTNSYTKYCHAAGPHDWRLWQYLDMASAHGNFFTWVLCGASQRHRPTRGTNCVHHLGSPWSSAVVIDIMGLISQHAP